MPSPEPAIPVGDPLLKALGFYGGPTETMDLQTLSAAIDAGNSTVCASTPVSGVDQRSFARPLDGNGDSIADCDIGATEYGYSPTALDLEYFRAARSTGWTWLLELLQSVVFGNR